MAHYSILLVGHGKMGSALLEGWRNHPDIGTIDVVSPNHIEAHRGNLRWFRTLSHVPTTPDVVVFAVKPALLAELLPQYAQRFGTTPLYISVAAGKTLAFYHQHLGTGAHVVRAMPNTPALIGSGMTALSSDITLSAAHRTTATELMLALGKIIWLKESQMNAATAISGCGPAYVYLFLDALVRAGCQGGLSEEEARTLAFATIQGSCALASHTGKAFEELAAQVASPGGATEAALKVLTANNALETLLQQTVQAAITRSREMAD